MKQSRSAWRRPAVHDFASCLSAWSRLGLLCVLAGCASVEANDGGAAAVGCQQALEWDGAAKDTARHVAPDATSEEDGRTYHFDLAGLGGLRSLQAECGWGSYAECTFRASRAAGEDFIFSDLSTFAVWEKEGDLYLVYRIVNPRSAEDAAKRRVVRVGDPPVTVCNQIGDYANLI